MTKNTKNSMNVKVSCFMISSCHCLTPHLPFLLSVYFLNQYCPCLLSQLAEVFENCIDVVMKKLGFCCGKKYVFLPQALCCYGKQLCSINRDQTYYRYQNR